MLTEILKPDEEGVSRAAQLLLEGKLCALPTETVYGLAANGLNRDAIAGIFKAKGRPQDNPLILHIASMEELPALCHVTPLAERAAQAFWPGPLTMVLPKRSVVPSEVTAGLSTAAIRMPSCAAARSVIAKAGVPLAMPSANLSGRPSTTTAGHVAFDLGGKIEAILDGGPCTGGLESTVLLMTGKPRILRPGLVTKEQLEAVLGAVEIDPAVLGGLPDGQAAASPGMKYKHYAPKAAMYLVEGEQDAVTAFLQEKAKEDAIGILCGAGEEALFPGAVCISYGADDGQHAQRLFDALRKFDETAVRIIYARMPQENGVGLALLNRMIRASAHRIIKIL